MIPLLTQDQVKSSSAAGDAEKSARIRAYADEETRLVVSINKLRNEYMDVKGQLTRETEKDRSTFAVRRSVLAREVEAFEARKEQAMKPVRLIEEEVRKVLADNVSYGKVLDGRAAEIAASKERITERLEELNDRAQLLDEREQGLGAREAGVVAAEAEVERSTTVLGDKWLEYSDAVVVANERQADLAIREAAVEAGTRANESRAAELERRDAVQDERERGIVDGYATLESAQREILQGSLIK